jgi:uncharacterized protein (TIGR02145 family)
MGGKNVQGKYIPKTKRKVETKEELGWDGDNSSGFSGLPGGDRYYSGNFYSVGSDGYWWCASELNGTDDWNRGLYVGSSSLGRSSGGKVNGFAVRCVRD